MFGDQGLMLKLEWSSMSLVFDLYFKSYHRRKNAPMQVRTHSLAKTKHKF